MKILFLSIGQLKSLEQKGIYTDLLRQFVANDHIIYVVSPREKRLDLPTECIRKGSANFLWVRTGNITKTNLLEKGVSTIAIERLFLGAIKKYLAKVKFDLVLYSTPPITFERIIRYIKARDGARTYLLLKDIFPQNAVDLGMFSRKSLFYWYFRNKEKKLYRISDHIGCMSPANVRYILKHNPEISEQAVEVCPNSIEPLRINFDTERVRQIRAKYKIPADRIVFVYGGNLGKPQGVEFIIECLGANRFNDQVFFVIAGSGTEHNKLKTFLHDERLTNAVLFDQMPSDEYGLLVKACDIGLIFLDRRFTIPNFPSRILSYMQAAMPVLAATDTNTDIKDVVEQGEFGFWCESGDLKRFNKLIRQLCDPELRKKMGGNARLYLENNFTAKHAYDIIARHFIQG